MNGRSDLKNSRDALRDKLIGLGERSVRKSYYPELQSRLRDLERFKTLLDHCRDVILLADVASGRLLDANDAIRRDWGYEPARLQELTLRDLFPAETLDLVRARFGAEACAPEAGHGLLTQVRTREGNWIAAEISVGRAYYEHAECAVIVARDDSERRRMEQALRASEEALQLESRRKDEFLAMLAHELRNPLAPVMNAVSILSCIGSQDAAIVRQNAIIKRQVTHLSRLIEDLLDVSRINEGRISLRRERLDIRAPLAHAVDSLAGMAEERSLELSASLPDEPLWVDADPVRLEQVFVNLIHNSCKYTDRGGRIQVWAVPEPPASCVVRVRDTGVGIAPEHLEFIFGIFSQVDRTLDRAAGGLGLGLPLVSRLVQMHNGRVEAFSEGVGKGSEFSVHLPLAPVPAALPALPARS